MAGNARRGPHCIGIVFLCQEWRLWGLFFAGRNFGMKLMLPPIRQNVFLVAHHLTFLELLTLQKGPIVPFSVTTPPFGRNGRFGGARRRCATPPSFPYGRLLFPYCRMLNLRCASCRRMLNLRCASCGVNAFETHITLRCNMRVTFVKRCTHTLETLHSLPSPCGAAHRHAPVATRPPRLELPGLGQWGK